jgi:hypothetical protein
VADVSTGDRALQEPVDHHLGRQVAPPVLEVARVLHLVVYDRLLIDVAVQDRPAEVGDGGPVLDTRVGDELVGVVEQPRHVADREQAPVRVGS